MRRTPNTVDHAAPPQSLRRDLRRFHAGRLVLSDAALERRLFGRDACAPEENLGAALLRLGLHKMDEDAPRYDMVRAGLRLLPRPDMTILDIGCGRGRVLLYAALLGAPRATGIEILEARAALARRAAAAHLAPGAVTIVQGDALKLPWPEADALIAMNPFYPSAYRRFRARLLDYARGRETIVVATSTLRDRLAADRRFGLRAEIALDWIRLASFQVFA